MILNQIPAELTTAESNYVFRMYLKHCVKYNHDRMNIIFIYKGFYINLYNACTKKKPTISESYIYVEDGKFSEFKPQPKIRNRDKYLRDKLRRAI